MEDIVNSADGRDEAPKGGPRRKGAVAVVLGVALSAALVVTGLTFAVSSGDSSGKKDKASENSASAGKPGSRRDKNMAFAECLRENGVEKFPDPAPDGALRVDQKSGIDVNGETYKKAEKTCMEISPPEGMRQGGGPGQPGGPGAGGQPGQPGAKERPDTTKYVACMRKNGQPKFPEPDAQGMFTGIDLSTPEYKAAQQACAKHMPMGPASPPPGA